MDMNAFSLRSTKNSIQYAVPGLCKVLSWMHLRVLARTPGWGSQMPIPSAKVLVGQESQVLTRDRKFNVRQIFLAYYRCVWVVYTIFCTISAIAMSE